MNRLALFIVALSGFVSLSYEILWFRVYAFLTGGTAASFGVVLSAFLLGIAVGSFAARRFCKDASATGQRASLQIPAILMVLASLGGYLLVPLVAWTVQHTNFAITLIGVALVAGTFGAILPLIAHFCIPPDERAGERLSHLYLANIVGSAAGSLVTGFVLLDHMPLAGACVWMAVTGLLLASLLFWIAGTSPQRRGLTVGLCLLLAGGAMADANTRYDSLYEKLLYKKNYSSDKRFAHTVETRSGVINVTEAGQVYGGGVYDGVFSTSLVPDRNLAIRPYALAGIHPAPRDVLMIGLSSGSWAQIIAHNPDVETLTVIEINPGYLELLERYPEIQSLQSNPKVTLVMDDGRRWITANPDRHFDAVIMNTTWHWRGHITNLLSSEFFERVRAQLKPGGVFGYNATGSEAAQLTGCSVFAHGLRVVNFMYVSDTPVVIDKARWRERLLAYEIDGEPVFDLDHPIDAARLEEVLEVWDSGRKDSKQDWSRTCTQVRNLFSDRRVVTDDNMETEFYRPWWMVYGGP